MPVQRPKHRFAPASLHSQLQMARRHAQWDEQLVRVVERQPAALVTAQATPEARKLYNLASQVRMEHQRLTCYLRLQIHPHGILWARHTPTHQIEDTILAHFAYRFPMYVIVLGSDRGTFTTQYRHDTWRFSESLEQVLDTIAQTRPLDPLLQELKATDDGVWEAFYKSQYVPQKHNTALFHKNVPARFLEMDTFTIEKNMIAKTRGLGAFLKHDEV